MHFQFLLAVLCIVPMTVLGAAKPKFAAVALKLASQSRPPNPGSYYFKNIGTGQMIAYNQKQYQSIFLAKKGSPMTARRYGKYMKVTPTTSNNKCFSAQWHFGMGADWACVLYACSKNNQHTQMRHKRSEDHSVEKRAKMGPVRPDKQLWIVKPGPQRGTFFIIATDHITDQPTKAIGDCTIKQVQEKKALGLCLQPLNPRDKGQLWAIYNSRGKMVRRDIMEELEEDQDYDDINEFDSQFSEEADDVIADEYSEAPEEGDVEDL